MMTNFEFATDSATMCVYDLERLKHRLTDDPDWWSIASDELSEVNLGNAVFLNLGDDGIYGVEIVSELPNAFVNVNFVVSSGKVFAGSADEVTSDGLEPEGLRGIFITLDPGNYRLSARRDGNKVSLAINSTLQHGNSFANLVRI